ncbi:MAG TPA: hypothetical protein VFW98_18775 [Gemmatimonadaceae bacterium]|nr:hypothetical protein [Gemmatimonadaceae bacterium]
MNPIALVPLFALSASLGPASPALPPAHTVPPVITVIATDFAFSLPSPGSVPAGPVTFRLINRGKELHMMGIVWLGTHTMSEFFAAVQADSVFAGPYEVGGPNAVAPGDTSLATVILEPGHAALACWVVGEDGKMHVLKGMVAPLEVVPSRAARAAEPRTATTITLQDYAIHLSGAPTPGRQLFRVENNGPAEHDVELFRLAPGATMADIDAWFEHPAKGSPRARPLGGMVGLDRGHHGWFTARLTPGDYVLLCLMPGEKNVPHYKGHGMLTRFHVGAVAVHGGGEGER